MFLVKAKKDLICFHLYFGYFVLQAVWFAGNNKIQESLVDACHSARDSFLFVYILWILWVQ